MIYCPIRVLMNSTVLKLEETFHLQKAHYRPLSLLLALCKGHSMRTDTWTNIILKKNWQICLLFPVPKQFLLVFRGKFKSLMQSGFFLQPSKALNYSSKWKHARSQIISCYCCLTAPSQFLIIVLFHCLVI